MARLLPSLIPTHMNNLSFSSTPAIFFFLAVAIFSVFSIIAFLCASSKVRKSLRLIKEETKFQSNEKKVVSKLNSNISSKALSLVKMISWRKARTERGEEEEEDEVDDYSDEAVWRKTIMLGERCRPLDFSGMAQPTRTFVFAHDMLDLQALEEDEDLFDTMFLVMLATELYEQRLRVKVPARTLPLRGNMYITHMLTGHPGPCYEMFRMEPPEFIQLCKELREMDYMQNTREVSVEEAVAIFITIAGHCQGQRMAADRFQHSTETINRHFKTVMRALGQLARTYIRVRHRTGVHPHVQGNPLYYPWFQKCIGAIDGTHVKAWVPAERQTSFRGRKSECTQNVMAACDFDMYFTYVYVGWEGTAHDGRVFRDAIRPENGFEWPTEGHYYVVDSAYPCTRGFMPPYKGERYHLVQFRGRRLPRGYKELFNYRHSSLRMIIEQCFGLLKNRWRILHEMPRYHLPRQPSIVIACCTLHNFIKEHNPNDMFFRHGLAQEANDNDEMEEDDNDEAGPSNTQQYDLTDEAALEMGLTREEIGHAMWSAMHGE